MTAFSEGDLVQHKAGGPAMVVRSIPGPGRDEYMCTWFKGASQDRGTFREHELQSYLPPSP